MAGHGLRWSREDKERATSLVELLQGAWALHGSCAASRDTVAEWLTAFHVDGTAVSSEDGTKQQLEIVFDVKAGNGPF